MDYLHHVISRTLGKVEIISRVVEVDDDRPCPPEWDPMVNPQSRRLPIEVIAND